MKPQRKFVNVEAFKKMLAQETEPEILYFEKLRFNPSIGVVSVGRKAIELPLTECKLLTALMLKKGKTLSRATAFDVLYWERSENEEPTPKAVDIWMYYLRQHLKPLGYEIKNQYTFGWRLLKSDGKADKSKRQSK